MFCTNCGEKIEDGFLFCDNCGKRIDLFEFKSKEEQLLIEDKSIVMGNNEEVAHEQIVSPIVTDELPLNHSHSEIGQKHIEKNDSEFEDESNASGFCTNCGEPLENGFHFCTNCGTPISETAEIPVLLTTSSNEKKTAEEVELKNNNKKTQEKKQNGVKGSNIIIAVLLALALVLGLALYFAIDGQYLDYLPGGKNTSLAEAVVTNESATKETTSSSSGTASGIELRNENDGWFAYRDGRRASDYTGLVENDFGEWVVDQGKVDFSANGVFELDGSWIKVVNGHLDKSFTGVASNTYGSWYVEEGIVDFSFSGKVVYDGTTYDIENGKVL